MEGSVAETGSRAEGMSYLPTSYAVAWSSIECAKAAKGQPSQLWLAAGNGIGYRVFGALVQNRVSKWHELGAPCLYGFQRSFKETHRSLGVHESPTGAVLASHPVETTRRETQWTAYITTVTYIFHPRLGATVRATHDLSYFPATL